MAAIASLTSVVAHLAASHFLRTRLQHSMSEGLSQACLLEFVAAVEMCCVSFELGIVAEKFGVTIWALCIFLLILWRGRSWGGTSACPYVLIEQYIEAGVSPIHITLKIAAQLAGAITASRWMKQLWMLELGQIHIDRRLDHCTADLQVPVMIGFLIECVLTGACCLVSRTLSQLEPKFRPLIDSFFTTAMVLLALDYSGGYFNPVLATGLKWSCRGHTNLEHILVYWAGSITGSLISLRLWNHPGFRNRIMAYTKTKKQ